MTETEPKHTNLWAEVLKLVNAYASGDIEKPEDRLKEIGEQLGGSSHEIEDINGLMRIAKRAKGEM
jgi:hypothetical protein